LAINQADETKRLLDAQQTIQEESVSLLERQWQAGAISSFELTQARLARTPPSSRWAMLSRNAPARALTWRRSWAWLRAHWTALDFPPLISSCRRVSNLASPAASLAQSRGHPRRVGGIRGQPVGPATEIAKQYPDITLSPGYEFDQGDNKWSLG